MLLTAADLRLWIGAPAMDPFGTPLGEVAAVLADLHSGAPEWLVLADAQAQEGRLVPLAGAVPSGRHVRVAPTDELVREAPAVSVGGDVDAATKTKAAAHYGLALDMERSPTGLLTQPPRRSGAGSTPRPPSTPVPAQMRAQIVEGLRAAHAMEQASLKMLAAMRRRTRDQELVHDLVLHHKATDDHAERVLVRLDELGASRARPLDRLATLGASLEARRARLRRVPEPADLAEACRFEQAEASAYRGLRDLAGRAGDDVTAKLCAANLADEVAMIMTLRNFRH